MKAHPNVPDVYEYGIKALIKITEDNGKYHLKLKIKLNILNFIK